MPKTEQQRAARRLAHTKWFLANKEKAYAKNKAWREANPEKSRAGSRKRFIANNYRLTVEQYTSWMQEPCAICGGQATDLDHDHKTGLNRGSLCHPCNTGLGAFRDSPANLDSAGRYLIGVAHES